MTIKDFPELKANMPTGQATIIEVFKMLIDENVISKSKALERYKILKETVGKQYWI